MYRFLLEHPVQVAAHLEAAVGHNTLDEQVGRLDDERLQKEDASKGCAGRHTRQLKVARTREDDTTLNEMVCNEGVQYARSARVEDDGIDGRWDGPLHKGMRRFAPCERVPAMRKRGK
jgi:hypothetical protein